MPESIEPYVYTGVLLHVCQCMCSYVNARDCQAEHVPVLCMFAQKHLRHTHAAPGQATLEEGAGPSCDVRQTLTVRDTCGTSSESSQVELAL